jgi:16S rRNA (uracil1498-N3)-methyltransferase
MPITLLQSLPKGRKFEWILQKGTELGVTDFWPLLTQHTVTRPNERSLRSKLARWRRIVTEAAEQSRRAIVPQVHPPRTLHEACGPIAPGTLALLLTVHAEAVPLREALGAADAPCALRLYVGPEGGFSTVEVEMAREAGIVLVSLGSRILRAETAPIAALSAILYDLGELG